MKKLPFILAAVICVLWIGASQTAHAAYPNGYSFQRAISIATSSVTSTETLSNFPVLVSVTTSTLTTTSTGGNVQNINANDIIFTSDSAGNTTSSWEIEKYVSSTGELVAWVKVGTLNATSSPTTLYMWYGNGAVSTFQSSSTAVWDSNFKGVWHMPTPTSTLSSIDSTSNKNNFTNNTATATSTAKIDGGASYTIAASTTISNFSNLLTGITTLSNSAWFLTNNTSSNTSGFIAGVRNQDGNDSLYISQLTNSANIEMRFRNSAAGAATLSITSAITNGTWNYLVITYDGSVARGYVNGIQRATSTGTGSFGTNGNPYNIGTDGFQHFIGSGSVDETRVSISTRSAAWIFDEYQNQSSPSTFAVVGAEQTPAVSSVSYRGFYFQNGKMTLQNIKVNLTFK